MMVGLERWVMDEEDMLFLQKPPSDDSNHIELQLRGSDSHFCPLLAPALNVYIDVHVYI